MLTSVTIENFRNLDCLTLERLGRVTLIGGQNGSGKTALLEALFLFSGPDLPELSERVNAFRGLPPPGREHVFRSIFNEYDTAKPIRISACGDWDDKPRTLDISVRERRGIVAIHPDAGESRGLMGFTRSQMEGNHEIVFKYSHGDGTEFTSRAWWGAEEISFAGPTPSVVTQNILQESQRVPNKAKSVFMPPIRRIDPQSIASQFGELQLEGEEGKALDFIRLLEPRLQGLTLIPLNDVPIIHAKLKGVNRPIPIQLMGEGLNRMLGLFLAMNDARGGLVLIDEIENGLHHKVQEQVFSDLLKLARVYDVQVFATTHSSECLRAAYVAHEKQEALDDFAYYRLDRIDGMAKAFQFDSEMIETAIELNWEIR
jgi:hypothetical protein